MATEGGRIEADTPGAKPFSPNATGFATGLSGQVDNLTL